MAVGRVSSGSSRGDGAGKRRRPVRAGGRSATALLALIAILVAGAQLRLGGSDWDAGHHLHPDERYLSLVAESLSLPDSASAYLDVQRSPLSPYRQEVGRGYLYGTLPLFATKVAARVLNADRYDSLYLVGRRLSALLDVITIVAVFLLSRAIVGGRASAGLAWAPALAAAFYAGTVAAIQHSHFFTVDSWLVAFSTLALLAAIALAGTPRGLRRAALLVVLGSVFGLAVACKLSGVLLAAPVGLAIIWGTPRPRRRSDYVSRLADVVLDAVLVALAAYAFFRLTSPYAFASGHWWDLRLHPALMTALQAQADAVAGQSLAPPNIQWLSSTPIVGPLANLLTWAMPIVGAVGLVGIGLVLHGVGRRVFSPPNAASPLNPAAILVAAFAFTVLVWFTPRFAHPLRYLLPAVPSLCALAALVIVRVHARRPRLAALMAVCALGVTSVWAVAFTSVYRRPHTRVAAADWIERTVAPGAQIAVEHWDEGIPIDPAAYGLREVPVFDAESPAKADALFDALAGADAYVMGSPRAWWTVGRLERRYPHTAAFYRLLLAGRLGFERAIVFRSEPAILGITISDAVAEEAQWVYDHPRVTVLVRTSRMRREEFRRAIVEAVRDSSRRVG